MVNLSKNAVLLTEPKEKLNNQVLERRGNRMAPKVSVATTLRMHPSEFVCTQDSDF